MRYIASRNYLCFFVDSLERRRNGNFLGTEKGAGDEDNSRSSVSNVRMEETKKGDGERKGKERKKGSERDSGEKSQLLCVAQRSNGKERRG